MFNDDGTFNHGHINNWQHAAMYLAYMVAGVVDLAGHYTHLPPDSEQVHPPPLPSPFAPCDASRVAAVV